MIQPYATQQNWSLFQEKCKNENKNPRKELANHLRMIADIVEIDNYPDVFGCILMNINENGKFTNESFIGTVSVTLSNPWPG